MVQAGSVPARRPGPGKEHRGDRITVVQGRHHSMTTPSSAAAPTVETPLFPTIEARKQRFRADPGFDQAMRVGATTLVNQFRGSWLLNRILNDRGRFLLSILVLHLHFEWKLDNSKVGLTTGRLKTLCTEQNICSPGRAGAVLATMQLLGLVEPRPTPDKRIKALSATDRLVSIHRDRWRKLFTAIRPLVPNADTTIALIDDDAFLAAFVGATVERFLAGFRVLDAAPTLWAFAERDSGVMIAVSLVLSVPPQDGSAEAAAARVESGGIRAGISIAALAQRFSVSRSHVLGVLRAGEEAGLIARGSAAGSIVLQPLLIEAISDFFANAFAILTDSLATALVATGHDAD